MGEMFSDFCAALLRHPVATGLTGTATTFTATLVSLITQLEMVLRIASLGVGLCVGCLTLAITWRRWREGRPIDIARKL